MAKGYGQYCPLALAAELLCPRWTMLVASRLLDGCTRFNEIQRSLPQISPSLLSARLSELVDAGIIVARRLPGGAGREYALTEAGRELGPIIDQLAIWGQRWARDMAHEDLDPAFLVWSMHARVDVSALPPGRTVIEFRFTRSPTGCRRFWLVCAAGDVEMCLKDPGFDIDVAVRSDLRVFVEAWRGFRDLRAEIAAGRIRVDGPDMLTRRLPRFLLGSALAPHPRRRPGRERELAGRRSAHTARKTQGLPQVPQPAVFDGS